VFTIELFLAIYVLPELFMTCNFQIQRRLYRCRKTFNVWVYSLYFTISQFKQKMQDERVSVSLVLNTSTVYPYNWHGWMDRILQHFKHTSSK